MCIRDSLFKEDVGSILLGTESFWTGIDVAGEALTGLVIDKLPFPPPDDPVIDAICERDPRAFDNYLVPLAIIALRQGVGRLIRCKTDVGVAVILSLIHIYPKTTYSILPEHQLTAEQQKAFQALPQHDLAKLYSGENEGGAKGGQSLDSFDKKAEALSLIHI